MNEDNPSAAMETRRRRAAYRAGHRGTKEMDWLLGRFAEARLGAMSAAEIELFERLLTIPDPELQQWIIEPERMSRSDFAGLIAALRQFHDLDPSAE